MRTLLFRGLMDLGISIEQGVMQPVAWPVIETDTASGWDAENKRFVVPESLVARQLEVVAKVRTTTNGDQTQFMAGQLIVGEVRANIAFNPDKAGIALVSPLENAEQGAVVQLTLQDNSGASQLEAGSLLEVWDVTE